MEEDSESSECLTDEETINPETNVCQDSDLQLLDANSSSESNHIYALNEEDSIKISDYQENVSEQSEIGRDTEFHKFSDHQDMDSSGELCDSLLESLKQTNENPENDFIEEFSSLDCNAMNENELKSKDTCSEVIEHDIKDKTEEQLPADEDITNKQLPQTQVIVESSSPPGISFKELSDIINEVDKCKNKAIANISLPFATETNCFKHGTEPVLAVNAFSEEFTWFHCNNSKFTERMNEQGKVTKQIYIGGWTSSFVVVESGDMIYTEFEGGTMQKVYKTGKVEEFWTTKPLMPLGVSMALDGSLLVCLVDKDSYEVDGSSMRMVQQLTIEGHLTETYEFADDKKTRLFNFPYRVAENYNTDICVVDRQSKDDVKVKVVSFDRKLRFVYDGRRELQDRFHPSGIVCDSACRIIITDFNNHCIHVLNQEGLFIKFLTTEAEGLKYPYCLSLYNDSQLWVGCKDGILRVYKYHMLG